MLDGEAVAIRCAHGDTILHPVALLQVVVGTRTMEVRPAVSETLPVDGCHDTSSEVSDAH